MSRGSSGRRAGRSAASTRLRVVVLLVFPVGLGRPSGGVDLGGLRSGDELYIMGMGLGLVVVLWVDDYADFNECHLVEDA